MNNLDCGVKGVGICKQYNLCLSTPSTLTLSNMNKAKLKDMVDAGKVLNLKHNCESFLPQVERALHVWFNEMQSKPHAPSLNQALLTSKAI